MAEPVEQISVRAPSSHNRDLAEIWGADDRYNRIATINPRLALCDWNRFRQVEFGHLSPQEFAALYMEMGAIRELLLDDLEEFTHDN